MKKIKLTLVALVALSASAFANPYLTCDHYYQKMIKSDTDGLSGRSAIIMYSNMYQSCLKREDLKESYENSQNIKKGVGSFVDKMKHGFEKITAGNKDTNSSK